MSFLDEASQDWTRPELQALRDLFGQAYRRPVAAEDLADASGLVPGTYPDREDMRLTWTALIKVMGAQGRLRALVQNAAADPGAASYRPRFEEMLHDRPAVPPPQLRVSGEWWKGDDQSPAIAGRLQLERLMERRSRLIDIELAEEVVAAARSVAKLSLFFGSEPGYGTGFLIGPDQLLTNHHNVMHESYGQATRVVADFDYDQGVHSSPLWRQARTDHIVSDQADDWAVLTLEAPVDRPPLRLGTPFEIAANDLVVIIQHPLGAFKQFALEPLAVRHVDEARIQYVADTQHGSSGSPVFNSKMHIIALHHAEAEVQVRVDGRAETVWRNQGIHIARITRGLRAHGISFTGHGSDRDEQAI
jgi:Trypsin-like peptidase domain/Effector-associated domain 1